MYFYLFIYFQLQHVCFVSGVTQADYWWMKRGDIVIPLSAFFAEKDLWRYRCFLFFLPFFIFYMFIIFSENTR